MTTDFRALCAELLQECEHLHDDFPRDKELWDRARAALSAPEQGPTDEDLDSMLYYEFTTSTGHGERSDPIGFARAVLARWGRPGPGPGPTDQELYDVAEQFNGDPIPAMRRALELWGRPAVEPVPVAERLPGPEDRDAKGRCWLWSPEDACWFWERIDSDFVKRYGAEFLWLPHWALPVPQEGADG